MSVLFFVNKFFHSIKSYFFDRQCARQTHRPRREEVLRQTRLSVTKRWCYCFSLKHCFSFDLWVFWWIRITKDLYFFLSRSYFGHSAPIFCIGSVLVLFGFTFVSSICVQSHSMFMCLSLYVLVLHRWICFFTQRSCIYSCPCVHIQPKAKTSFLFFLHHYRCVYNSFPHFFPLNILHRYKHPPLTLSCSLILFLYSVYVCNILFFSLSPFHFSLFISLFSFLPFHSSLSFPHLLGVLRVLHARRVSLEEVHRHVLWEMWKALPHTVSAAGVDQHEMAHLWRVEWDVDMMGRTKILCG